MLTAILIVVSAAAFEFHLARADVDPETKKLAAPYVAQALDVFDFTAEEQRPWRENYAKILAKYEALRTEAAKFPNGSAESREAATKFRLFAVKKIEDFLDDRDFESAADHRTAAVRTCWDRGVRDVLERDIRALVVAEAPWLVDLQRAAIGRFFAMVAARTWQLPYSDEGGVSRRLRVHFTHEDDRIKGALITHPKSVVADYLKNYDGGGQNIELPHQGSNIVWTEDRKELILVLNIRDMDPTWKSTDVENVAMTIEYEVEGCAGRFRDAKKLEELPKHLRCEAEENDFLLYCTCPDRSDDPSEEYVQVRWAEGRFQLLVRIGRGTILEVTGFLAVRAPHNQQFSFAACEQMTAEIAHCLKAAFVGGIVPHVDLDEASPPTVGLAMKSKCPADGLGTATSSEPARTCAIVAQLIDGQGAPLNRAGERISFVKPLCGKLLLASAYSNEAVEDGTSISTLTDKQGQVQLAYVGPSYDEWQDASRRTMHRFMPKVMGVVERTQASDHCLIFIFNNGFKSPIENYDRLWRTAGAYWAIGQGRPITWDQPWLAEYMMADRILPRTGGRAKDQIPLDRRPTPQVQLERDASSRFAVRRSEAVSFPIEYVEVENGWQSGVELLHGTNSDWNGDGIPDVPGFLMQGSAAYRENEYYQQVDYDLKCTWTDRMDIHASKYKEDLYLQMVKLGVNSNPEGLFKLVDYDAVITWPARCSIRRYRDGTKEYLGWPFRNALVETPIVPKAEK